MEFIPLALKGAYALLLDARTDARGVFVKTFHEEEFRKRGLEAFFPESYYSVSVKNVIRGMHFQMPPHDQAKLVYATEGAVMDVLVDLRKKSPAYGQYCTLELSAGQRNGIYIPRGMAHGFGVLSESATLVYMTSSLYHPSADSGIKWDSFGFRWPVTEPILSERDRRFPALSDFKSPF